MKGRVYHRGHREHRATESREKEEKFFLFFSFCSLCSLWPLCALWFILCGCQHDVVRQAVREKPRPFVEQLPGSTVTFMMRPVTTRDSSDHLKIVWFAETETTWDAYDVFYLRLDDTGGDIAAAGREGPDAITRPTQPYSPPDRGWGHGGYPAIGVTFLAATKYCEWLSAKTGRRYRLPTTGEFRDAVWETCGSSHPTPSDVPWLAENAGETTHPVASKRPNSRGLYDTLGNVAEWCVGADGKPTVCGLSFADAREDVTDDILINGRRQTRAWNASDPSYPPSKWWLRDAPFVGFRVVCEEGPQ